MSAGIVTESPCRRTMRAWISFQEWPMTNCRSSASSSAPRRRTASTTDSTLSRSESTRVPSRSNRMAAGMVADVDIDIDAQITRGPALPHAVLAQDRVDDDELEALALDHLLEHDA